MSLMMMELRDIDYFAAVAHHGHLGRAAEALGLGQPALSMSLRRLERSAQAKLVKRTPKGVELTAVGAALLSHAGRLRLAREDLAREVADLAHGRAGHLRIGASPSNVDVTLPDACGALLLEAPKVTVNVAVLDNDALLPALRNGERDLALTHTRQPSSPDVALESVREDEFVVYCAAGHRLARRRSIALADLAQERWAVAASATQTLGPLSVLTQACEDAGLAAPAIALVSDLVMFRLRAVAHSDLLGIAVRPNIEEVAERLRLKVLPFRRAEWTRRVAVAYRKDGYLSPAARRFIDILKTTAARN
jgi:DNA-binding transcriptional LysR family regulator